MQHFETFQIYFTKFVLTGLMLFFPFMEELSITLKLVAAFAGIVLTVFTINRMYCDIKIRREELKIKELNRKEAEFRIEEYLTKKYS